MTEETTAHHFLANLWSESGLKGLKIAFEIFSRHKRLHIWKFTKQPSRHKRLHLIFRKKDTHSGFLGIKDCTHMLRKIPCAVLYAEKLSAVFYGWKKHYINSKNGSSSLITQYRPVFVYVIKGPWQVLVLYQKPPCHTSCIKRCRPICPKVFFCPFFRVPSIMNTTSQQLGHDLEE